jgi:hypothetical protein
MEEHSKPEPPFVLTFDGDDVLVNGATADLGEIFERPQPTMPLVYMVGDPDNGPFASFRRTPLPETEPERYEAAKAEAEKHGAIADEMDWSDDDGSPAVMFIVT